MERLKSMMQPEEFEAWSRDIQRYRASNGNLDLGVPPAVIEGYAVFSPEN
jgi:hypothetical protein